MTDPYYKEMKHQKREYEWVSNCVYANYKIPTKCICGGAITVEIDERGRNYYVCKDFKNDGLHIRHDCLAALEEELDCFRMREEIKELKQLIMAGKMSVKNYERYFYGLPIVRQRSEQELIQMAKDGLKEEIRESLETEEFPTLDALFEEAEEVEEMLKETPPSSPHKRRRRSHDHRTRKRARKAENKGDPEDEGLGYDRDYPNPPTENKDDEDGDVDEDASDRSDDTLGSGQFRMYDYPDGSGSDSSTSASDSSTSDSDSDSD
ncbi:hypothetical protein Bca4012_020307 [Brassica carinata]